MSSKTIDFEQAETVVATVYSVGDTSVVFVIGQGIVIEVSLHQDLLSYFKKFEGSTRVFLLHGIAQYIYLEDCELELSAFKFHSCELLTETSRRDFLNNFVRYGAASLGPLEDPYIALFIEENTYS